MNWKSIYRDSLSLQKSPPRFFIFATCKLWNYLVQIFLVGFSSFLISDYTSLTYLSLLKSFLILSRFYVFLKSLTVTTFSNWFVYKSCLSRFLVLINCTMLSSIHFSTSSCFSFFCFPRFSWSRFFRVQVFQCPSF